MKRLGIGSFGCLTRAVARGWFRAVYTTRTTT